MVSVILKHLLLVATSLVLVACGSSGNGAPPTAGESANKTLGTETSERPLGLKERFADFSGDVVRDKDGNILKESKRSSFENQKTAIIAGERSEKAFSTSQFSKKDWAGTKRFGTQQYEGTKSNRWDDSEYFLRQQAREANAVAGVQGSQFGGVSDFQTSTAREQTGRRIVGGSNLQSEVQQENFRPPIKINRRDYERLSLEDSNNLLGR